MMKQLKTHRLSLRSFEEQDTPLLYSWENELSSWASSMTLNPLSHKFIKDYILYSNNSIIEDGRLVLLAERLDTGEPIGYLQLLDYEALHQKLGLGVYVIEEAREKGFASELINWAKTYAFDVLHCRMIYAETLQSNTKACKLFQGVGFKQTAILPDWYWINGTYESLVYYQIWKG